MSDDIPAIPASFGGFAVSSDKSTVRWKIDLAAGASVIAEIPSAEIGSIAHAALIALDQVQPAGAFPSNWFDLKIAEDNQYLLCFKLSGGGAINIHLPGEMPSNLLQVLRQALEGTEKGPPAGVKPS